MDLTRFKLLRTEQVAEILNTSPAVVRNLTYRGKLLPCKRGRYNLYKMDEIERYMDDSLPPSKAEISRVANQDYISKRVNENRATDKKYFS